MQVIAQTGFICSVALAVLALSPESRAGAARGLSAHVSWLQSRMPGAQQCAVAASNAAAETPHVAALCAEQICGPARSVSNAANTFGMALGDPAQFGRAHSRALSEAALQIGSALDAEKKLRATALPRYRDALSDPQPDVDPRLEAFYSLSALLAHASAARARDPRVVLVGPNDRNPLAFDQARLRAALGDLSQAERDWAVAAIDRFYRSEPGIAVLQSQAMTLERYLRLRHPTLTFIDAFRAEGELLKRKTDDIRSGPEGPFVTSLPGASGYLEDDTIAKAVAGVPLSAEEGERFALVSAAVRLLVDLSDRRNRRPASVPEVPNPTGVREALLRGNASEKVEGLMRVLNDPSALQAQRKEAFDYCFQAFFFQLAVSPTEEQLAEARRNETRAKDRAKAALRGALSTRTSAMLDQRIDRLSFRFPPNRSAFMAAFRAKLEDKRRNLEGEAEDHARATKSGVLVDLFSQSSDREFQQLFRETKNACKKFAPRGLDDKAVTPFDQIETSWMSVAVPEAGRQTMLHEIGHITFDQLTSGEISTESRAKFEDISKCLVGLHSVPGRIGQAQFLEEDWSDLLAAKASSADSGNLFCSLLETNNGEFALGPLQDSESDGLHSEKLFRLLHFQTAQNRALPSACRQVVESSRPSVELRACF